MSSIFLVIHVFEVSKVSHVVFIILKVFFFVEFSFVFFVVAFFSLFVVTLFFWVLFDLFVGECALVDLGVIFQPLFQSVQTTTVSGNSFLVAFGVEDESGEAFNRHLFVLVQGGIVLCNDDVRDVFDVLAELLPVRGQALTVSAPGCIVLHKHIFRLIEYNLLELVSNYYLDGAVIFIRNGLTLEEGLQFAVVEVGHKLRDILDCNFSDISLVLEFANVVFSWLHDTDGGEVLGGDSDEFAKLLLDTIGDTRVGEENLALELFRCRVHFIFVGLLSFEE